MITAPATPLVVVAPLPVEPKPPQPYVGEPVQLEPPPGVRPVIKYI